MIESQGYAGLSGLKYQPVGPSDAEMICSNREQMFLEAGGNPEELRVMTEHFRPWLEERLGDGRYYGFKLLDGDQPVAAIGLMSIDWPPHPAHPTLDKRGYVLNVYVQPAYRRRGLASALMQAADAEFARRGITFAVLHATETGKPVYAQSGWVGTAEMAKSIALQ
ncbi:GNAT family N-acetyltransferase [Pseudomonas alloputida]|uniref:GNAT family N-acetyltransferase n=1 Tax=Pseudomonas TaxID=286 RepID=UPI003EE833CC